MNRLRLVRAVATLSFSSALSVVFAAGCGSDENLVGGMCAAGYTQCGNRCIDTENDPDNCGGCGNACSAASECSAGSCGPLTIDGSVDGAAKDGSIESGAADSPYADSLLGEASLGDGAAGDGTTGDGTTGDGTTGDGATGDGATGDGTTGDGTTGDGTTGDGMTGDRTIGPPPGDGSVGDGSPGDGSQSLGDTAIGDGAALPDGSVGDGSGGDGSTGNADGADGEAGDATLEDGGTADGAEPPDTGNPDGACPPGTYDTPQACGDCNTVCSGLTPLCAPSDGGFACAPVCTGALTACDGQCVDITSDPSNCGVCDNVCPSQICQISSCVGTTTGGIVFIGHDYQAATAYKTTLGTLTTQAQVLFNAVFIPRSNPVRVLSYNRYADPTALQHVNTILTTEAVRVNHGLSITATMNDSDIPNNLSLLNYDVLLVPDQPRAPNLALGLIGVSWAPELAAFAASGGVIVVLDGGLGIGEMPAFVTGTGLLAITAQAPVAAGTFLDDVGKFDIEGFGLTSPYVAGADSVSVTTEPNGGGVAYVIVTPADAGSSSPVVVHKAF